MATTSQLITFLPQYLREQSHAFTPETLIALDQILATLDTTSETQLYEAMVQWFQGHSDEEADCLDHFFASNRELGNKSAQPENQDAKMLQNSLEECKQLRQKQKNEDDSRHDD